MSDSGDGATDAGYEGFLRAVDEGEGIYLQCPNEHGSLPPRRVCPHCGSPDLEDRPLPEAGTVETFTTVHVSIPDFETETPYITAIAAFGPVRLTGLLSDVENEGVETGMTVGATVERNEATGDRTLAFRLR